MNPNNEIIKTPEPNLPIPIGQNLPVPAEPKAVVPVKLDMSPEDMGKALQLRHETRLTVKEPDLPPIDLSFWGEGETYKEPIRLNFGDEIEPGKRRMHSGASGRLIGRAVGAVVATAVMAAHQKVHEVENENSAVKGAHRAEIISEHSVRSAARSYNRYRARQRNQLRDEPNREKPKKSNPHQGDHSDHTGDGKARDHKRDNRRQQQRARIKKDYQIAARSKSKGTLPPGNKGAKAAGKADKIKEIIGSFFKNNKGLFYALIALGILFLLMLIGLGSCTSMFAGVSTPMITTTYPSTDAEMLAVESAYASLEAGLNAQIGRIEQGYQGYETYNYHLNTISHNPYYLISYFSAKYGNFKYEDVKTELQQIFQMQYTLSIYSTSEQVSYTEIVYEGDPPVAVEVEKKKTIYHLHIYLTNHDLDTLLRSRMTADQIQMYDLYNMTYGNRSDLFDLTGSS